MKHEVVLLVIVLGFQAMNILGVAVLAAFFVNRLIGLQKSLAELKDELDERDKKIGNERDEAIRQTQRFSALKSSKSGATENLNVAGIHKKKY